jgi:hypothetical protein
VVNLHSEMFRVLLLLFTTPSSDSIDVHTRIVVLSTSSLLESRDGQGSFIYRFNSYFHFSNANS